MLLDCVPPQAESAKVAKVKVHKVPNTRMDEDVINLSAVWARTELCIGGLHENHTKLDSLEL